MSEKEVCGKCGEEFVNGCDGVCDDCLEENENCKHTRVAIRWRLYAMETRECPAEYVGRARCKDCGEEFDPDDIPENAEVEEE